MTPEENMAYYKSEIKCAAAGDKDSELWLRKFLVECAATMPLRVLILVSTTMMEDRLKELGQT